MNNFIFKYNDLLNLLRINFILDLVRLFINYITLLFKIFSILPFIKPINSPIVYYFVVFY